MDSRTGNDSTKSKIAATTNKEKHISQNPPKRLLTGVPIGSNKNTIRNDIPVEINKGLMKPPKPPPPQQQEVQNVNPNNLLSYGKGITQPDVPFMKSVLPVTSLFSSIKSGVQTSVTAAVKAGKQYH